MSSIWSKEGLHKEPGAIDWKNPPNTAPSTVDGWTQVRTSFYNELLTDNAELLEALKRSLDSIGRHMGVVGLCVCPDCEATRAAIARAEGREP